jgi:hypothetical protein
MNGIKITGVILRWAARVLGTLLLVPVFTIYVGEGLQKVFLTLSNSR